MKDFIGCTKVDPYLIEKALDNYNEWNNTWWDKLQSYRKELVVKFDKKPANRMLMSVGFKYSETYKINSFSGEYWSALKIIPDEMLDEFQEYYGNVLSSVAKGLRSLIVIGNEDPYVSAEGCNFIRRFTNQEKI